MTKTREEIIDNIASMATRMRRCAIEMAYNAGSAASHLGGGLSIIDITATLYGVVMKIDPHNPQWSERDRFILSKGHGVLGYYTALAEVGFISAEDIATFGKNDSFLLAHPVINRAKGIEFSNGSLGMGLSLGIGVALAGKRRHQAYNVYVLMGDGECNEGSVWEAAMAAPHFQLNNITAIIDRNNLQSTGSNAAIMPLGDLIAKWASFGWDVADIDGHNYEEIYNTLIKKRNSDKPLVIIAKTVKGKGVSFAENNNEWHHKVLTRSQYEIAMSEFICTKES